jgi:hypothetical protein
MPCHEAGPGPLPFPLRLLSLSLSFPDGKRITCLEPTPFPKPSASLLKHFDWPIEDPLPTLAYGGSPNSTLTSVHDKFPIGPYRRI